LCGKVENEKLSVNEFLHKFAILNKKLREDGPSDSLYLEFVRLLNRKPGISLNEEYYLKKFKGE